jgi:hypothetical protein
MKFFLIALADSLQNGWAAAEAATHQQDIAQG